MPEASVELRARADRLAAACGALRFGPPATHVYNPLVYAGAVHSEYLRRFARAPKRALFLGMNPGPWGMGQTGVPFGDAGFAREWMGLRGKVGAPENPHPQRPVHGLDCPRREVSGARLWGMFRERFARADDFFAENLVLNYCPLLFLDGRVGCRNVTPDKLRPAESAPLFALCDDYLRAAVSLLRPRFLIGVGLFAEGRLRRMFAEDGFVIGAIPHPSPANPAANRGFAEAAETRLREIGVWE